MRNPKLYLALKKVTGADPRVVNEGEPCRLVNVYPEYSFMPRTQELPASSTPGGEQYAVCCPFCGDTRFRLYVSHMWDAEFVQGNCRYHCSDRLIHCFNEQCMSNVKNWQKMCNAIRETMGEITTFDESDLLPEERSECNELANQCLMPQDAKSIIDPTTPKVVIDYIHNRGFDETTLSCLYNVQWICGYGKFKFPILVIPVQQNDEFWFWQGRLVPIDGTVDGPIEKDSATGKEFPKYYFPHGVKKNWALYNIDHACMKKTVFIVEGVTDVWATGQGEDYGTVAKFGKQLSVAQSELLTRKCFGKHLIMVPDMDDPEAFDVVCEDVMRLQIKDAFASVKIACPHQGEDPCDMMKRMTGKDGVACYLKEAAQSLSEARRMKSTFGLQANQ